MSVEEDPLSVPEGPCRSGGPFQPERVLNRPERTHDQCYRTMGSFSRSWEMNRELGILESQSQTLRNRLQTS